MPAGTPGYFADNALIDMMRSKVREWWGGVLRVRDMQTYGDKDLIDMRRKILERAFWIKEQIKKVVSADEAAKMGLGVLPLIPVALITALIGYMAYQLKDFAEFFKRQNYVEKVYNDAKSEGKSTQEAAAVATKAADEAGMPSSEMKLFGVPVKWIALGAIGVGIFLAMRGNSQQPIVIGK